MTPSANEFGGLWNVRQRDCPPGTVCLRTESVVPPVTQREFEDVRAAVTNVLVEAAVTCGLSTADAKELFHYSVNNPAGDRTALVDIPEPETREVDLLTMVDLALVQKLQEILATRRLWRIALNGEGPGTVVMIYPQAVRAGDHPLSAEPAGALRQTVETARELRRVRLEPQRRQWAHLRACLPESLARVRTSGFDVTAVFDNWKGDPTEISVWLLHRGHHLHAATLKKPQDAATSCTARVSGDGRISLPHSIEPGPFYLVQWVLKRDTLRDGIVVEWEGHAFPRPIAGLLVQQTDPT